MLSFDSIFHIVVALIVLLLFLVPQFKIIFDFICSLRFRSIVFGSITVLFISVSFYPSLVHTGFFQFVMGVMAITLESFLIYILRLFILSPGLSSFCYLLFHIGFLMLVVSGLFVMPIHGKMSAFTDLSHNTIYTDNNEIDYLPFSVSLASVDALGDETDIVSLSLATQYDKEVVTIKEGEQVYYKGWTLLLNGIDSRENAFCQLTLIHDPMSGLFRISIWILIFASVLVLFFPSAEELH